MKSAELYLNLPEILEVFKGARTVVNKNTFRDYIISDKEETLDNLDEIFKFLREYILELLEVGNDLVYILERQILTDEEKKAIERWKQSYSKLSAGA